MTDNLAGAYVIVKTQQGAYIGGVLWASSPNGALFIKKEEICLDPDFASNVGAWEALPKEAWRGKGEIVEDPREKQQSDFKPPSRIENTSGYWERLSLEDINCE